MFRYHIPSTFTRFADHIGIKAGARPATTAWVASLSAFEVGDSRYQRRAATRWVAFVGNPDAIDSVMWIAVGDDAVAMQWTGALIPDTSDSNAPHREMSGGDGFNFAAVARRVVQTDDVGHNSSSRL